MKKILKPIAIELPQSKHLRMAIMARLVSLDELMSDTSSEFFHYPSFSNDTFVEYSKEARESGLSTIISDKAFGAFRESAEQTLEFKVKDSNTVSIWTKDGKHVHMNRKQFQDFSSLVLELIEQS